MCEKSVCGGCEEGKCEVLTLTMNVKSVTAGE